MINGNQQKGHQSKRNAVCSIRNRHNISVTILIEFCGKGDIIKTV